MTRYAVSIALCAVLTGCGLAETASTTVAIAESEAQQAKAAKETQAKIEKQLQESQDMAAQKIKAADAASD